MSLINKIVKGDRSNAVFSSTVGPSITTAPGDGALVSAYQGYDLATGVIPFRNYRIGLSDLVGLGAFTTGDLILHTCEPGQVTLWTLVKHRTAIAGAGPVTAATARVLSEPLNSAANAAATNTYGTAFDVFQAVSDTAFDFDGTHPAVEAMGAQSQIILRVTTTGGNLSALTAGVIDVWFGFTNVSV
jgi:hypothetical protein